MTPAEQRAQELAAAGRIEEAVSVLRRHAQSRPKDPNAAAQLAGALLHAGQPEQAVYFAERANALAPAHRIAQSLLGVAYLAMGDAKKAEAVIRLQLLKRPEDAQSWANLGVAHLMQKRIGEGEEALRRGLALDAHMYAAAASLAQLLVQSGRSEEALASLVPLLAEAPDNTLVTSAAAYASNYCASCDGVRIRELHEMYGRALIRHAAIRQTPMPAAGPVPRPLRIGLVSPDLAEHAVARFVRAFLKHRDPSRVEFTAYYLRPNEDAVSLELKAHCARWRVAPGGTEVALAEQIRRDGIHVLIDLAGNTALNKLAVLARRAAPVQITAIGYPSTTGVPGVDFRIVDSTTDPVGAETHASERLLRIDPCFLCYTPDENLPGVEPGPLQRGEAPVFGSFNNLAKLSDDCVALWRRVLDGVPGSRLAIKGQTLGDARTREVMLGRLARHGIDASRLLLLDPPPTYAEHLRAYARVDVALDTHPYNGTTTTCEALMMGVPVVTLAGASARTHAGRVGISLLNAAGLSEFIGDGGDAYVRIATQLAGDVQRLAGLRSTLRGRVLSSTLCDGRGYAARFADAMERAWATLAGDSGVA